jgi:5-methylcytosine-specific restriction protein A
MKISDEMIKQSYIIAKRVYEEKLTLTDGADTLHKQFHLDEGSAKTFINNFRCLITGQQYTRTMNGNATKYYLQNILNDFGYNILENALQAVNFHILYYEGLKHGRLNNIRNIYKYFKKIQEQNTIYYEYNDEKELFFNEGKAKKVLVNIYERDQEARKKCLKYYGYKCFTCGILLSDIYGEIGENFIHVHHIIELSSIKKEYIVDPVKDLRPLCPNCHSIIHRKSPAISIEELKKLIKKLPCTVSDNHRH